jgi:hypothetical protein
MRGKEFWEAKSDEGSLNLKHFDFEVSLKKDNLANY